MFQFEVARDFFSSPISSQYAFSLQEAWFLQGCLEVKLYRKSLLTDLIYVLIEWWMQKRIAVLSDDKQCIVTEHHAKSLTWLLAISGFGLFNPKKVPNLRIYAMHVKVDLSVQISFPKFPKKSFQIYRILYERWPTFLIILRAADKEED